MLGGFHFNDRRYADDDLTLGSIDPYQVFRIFHEIQQLRRGRPGRAADIAYMIDQSHNLKGKIEAMIQTVAVAQELYAKAALVDHAALAVAQSSRPRRRRALPAGRLRHRRAAGRARVAHRTGPAGRSDGRVPRERLPRTDHERPRRAQCGRELVVRMT